MSDETKLRDLLKPLSLEVPIKTLTGDFEAVASHLNSSSSSRRRQVAEHCKMTLRKSSVARDRAARVAACKTLCAATPESSDVIRELLKIGRTRERYEVQFTLFCFLDNVPGIPRALAFAREIPSLVEDYLLNVPANTALAAWMGAHMMGDHWPRRAEAVRVLISALVNARYVEGRWAALMALQELLTEDIGSHMRQSIETALEQARLDDRSKSIRRRLIAIPHARVPRRPRRHKPTPH